MPTRDQICRTRVGGRARWLPLVAIVVWLASAVSGARAQNSSLAQREAAAAQQATAPQQARAQPPVPETVPSGPGQPASPPGAAGRRSAGAAQPLPEPSYWPGTMANSSWTNLPVLPRREVKIHDIVSVRVDILSRMTADGEMQRRKDARYDAQLKDWIVLEGLRAVGPAPQTQGDQRMRGQLRSDYRSLGELETRESLAFNVACEVADILPNGNLVLEGRAKVIVNEEMWTVMLSGLCRPEAIGPNNVVLSRDVAQLDIHKAESGSVAAGYQRGWFQKIFDLIQPF